MRISKGEMVDRFYKENKEHFSNRDKAQAAFDSVWEIARDILTSGDEFNVRQFGTFKSVYRGSYIGHDIHFNEPIEIPARMVPVFRPSSQLRADIREQVELAEE